LANIAARSCQEKKEYVANEYYFFSQARAERSLILHQLRGTFHWEVGQVNPLVIPYLGNNREFDAMDRAEDCSNDRTF